MKTNIKMKSLKDSTLHFFFKPNFLLELGISKKRLNPHDTDNIMMKIKYQNLKQHFKWGSFKFMSFYWPQ